MSSDYERNAEIMRLATRRALVGFNLGLDWHAQDEAGRLRRTQYTAEDEQLRGALEKLLTNGHRCVDGSCAKPKGGGQNEAR